MKTQNRLRAWLVLGLSLTLACPTHAKGTNSRDAEATDSRSEIPSIISKENRELDETAYALPGRTASIRTGLLGTGSDDLVAALGVDYGFGHGMQVGMNLAHAGVGLLNLSAKWSFLEVGPVAFAFGLSPRWIHGNWVWLSRDSQIVGNIDILAFPFRLSTSYLPFSFVQFDLVVGYTHTEVFGDMSSDSLAFDAGIAMRSLRFVPSVRFHVARRLSLFASAQLPMWTTVPGAVEGSVTLYPGVQVGARSGGTRSVPLKSLYVINLGARAMASRYVFLSFLLNYGALAERLYRNAWSPSLDVEVRF